MDIMKNIDGALMDPIEQILFTEEQIKKRVAELGQMITRDFAGKDLLVVCILKGSLYFAADLIRHVKMPLNLDFIAVSSYGEGEKTSGTAKLTKDLEEDIEGRHIIITEDILDTGLTLDYLVRVLKLRNPAEIRICTLLDKPQRRIKDNIVPDYIGFTIPEVFVVGYGLDYKHRYRHLPFICTFKKENIQEN
jgi:hypoxanthine phosphoribosyltransferase